MFRRVLRANASAQPAGGPRRAAVRRGWTPPSWRCLSVISRCAVRYVISRNTTCCVWCGFVCGMCGACTLLAARVCVACERRGLICFGHLSRSLVLALSLSLASLSHLSAFPRIFIERRHSRCSWSRRTRRVANHHPPPNFIEPRSPESRWHARTTALYDARCDANCGAVLRVNRRHRRRVSADGPRETNARAQPKQSAGSEAESGLNPRWN